jgi:hypothetical protein
VIVQLMLHAIVKVNQMANATQQRTADCLRISSVKQP